jgi:hypothetical protein
MTRRTSFLFGLRDLSTDFEVIHIAGLLREQSAASRSGAQADDMSGSFVINSSLWRPRIFADIRVRDSLTKPA